MSDSYITRFLPLIVFVGVTVIGYLLRVFLYRIFSSMVQKTESKVGFLILDATRLASILWVPLIALLLMLKLPSVLPDWLLSLSNKLLGALLILSFTLVVARVLADSIEYYAKRHGEEVLPVTSLTKILSRWIVVLLGILILFNHLGINITPILTALGIGGLAVALALQDTLSNLFAGFYVTLGRQVRVGQRIKLDSGAEGYLIDIGWRTTTLRTPSNTLVIIPNSKLSQSVITNYNLPENPVSVTFNIGVDYASDPEHVEKVLQEEAQKAVEELPGFVKGFSPIVRFQDFGDFSLNFILVFQFESYDAQFPIWGELHKRIFKRFKQEGINIPFPVRTIYLQDIRKN
jgi:small-conductance mechanosensitive channel